MSAVYEGALQDLVEEFGKLPGIGPKSAQRLAFHILQADSGDVNALAQALSNVKKRVRFCEICGNVSEEAECTVCQDPRRDRTMICVVEEPKDVVAIERTREYRGLYHVLGERSIRWPASARTTCGSRSSCLACRTARSPRSSSPPTPTSKARPPPPTSCAALSTLGVTVTRLASGLPVGGDLEYADEVTLGRAFSGRREVD